MDEEKDKPKDQKKRYQAPELIDYGSVEKLTQSSTQGDKGDGGANPANKRF